MPRSEKEKVDATIVVAIIGLIGTLAVAVLTSPILLKLFERTSATETTSPVATSIPPQDLKQIFKADFENGAASGFAFNSGDWKVVKDKSNYILQGTGTGPVAPAAIAYFGTNDFANGVIEFRVKFPLLTSNLYFEFRREEGNGSYVLYLAPGKQSIVLATNMLVNQDWQFSEVAPDTTLPFTFLKDTWYMIRLEVKGERMVVSIDGNQIISASDSRLARGRIRFALDPDSVVDFDDVNVWAYH